MKYYPKLNGIRGIAIMLVLLQHFGWFSSDKSLFGYYGVDLFFVLSAFLITFILLSTKEDLSQALITFYGRRALRIFPIYYSLIFFLYLMGNPNVIEHLTSLISYTFNYGLTLNNPQISEISHLWSLSVEEQFYIFWPLLILPLRKNQKALLIIIGVLVLLSFLQMAFNLFHLEKFNYVGTFPRTYSLGIGALGSFIFKRGKMDFLKSIWIDIGVVSIIVLTFFLNTLIASLLLPGLSLLIILKSCSPFKFFKPIEHLLNNNLIQKIGIVSYGIYVFHKPLAFYVFDPISDYLLHSINFSNLGYFGKIQYNWYIIPIIFYPILSFLFAQLSFRFFENPFLRLKQKFK